MTFTSINDAVAYIDSTVPGHELSDDDIRGLFHESGIEYGDWMDADDARLAAFAAAAERAAVINA